MAPAGTFTYIGVFSAAWEAEAVSFTGQLHGTVVDRSGNYKITTTSPQFINIGWIGIDELIISNTGQQWAMDNFTFTATPVPEPATMALLGAGILGGAC